jgi:hypothetical protein
MRSVRELPQSKGREGRCKNLSLFSWYAGGASAIEYGTVPMMAAEETRTPKPAVRATRSALTTCSLYTHDPKNATIAEDYGRPSEQVNH